jgi:hypothetical protein
VAPVETVNVDAGLVGEVIVSWSLRPVVSQEMRLLQVRQTSHYTSRSKQTLTVVSLVVL